jgi:hypothetical protein
MSLLHFKNRYKLQVTGFRAEMRECDKISACCTLKTVTSFRLQVSGLKCASPPKYEPAALDAL